MLRVFQSVRGLSDDIQLHDWTKMRDLTELHWARNLCGQRETSRLAWRISGLIHGVWGLWTTILDLIGACMSRMDLRVEEN